MIEDKRSIKHTIYTVSYKDLVDIWIESLHPDDNVVVIWDARNHLEKLVNYGLLIDAVKIYDNKILTVVTEDVRDALYFMDWLSSDDDCPFIQVYSNSKLLTDNIDSKH